MELLLDLSYNQVLRICKQLPRNDKKKLATTLELELKQNEQVDDNSLENLISIAPTWSDSDLNDYNNARQIFNKPAVDF